MIPVSSWYDSLGRYTFPTVFIGLAEQERRALAQDNELDQEEEEEASAGVVEAVQNAIRSLPGSCFIGADVCAPTDSPLFADSPSLITGERAWEMLRSSEKVRTALANRQTSRLFLRPFRNMNSVREFRLFFYKRTLVAMSQMNLQRHFARFARRQEFLWEEAIKLAREIESWLPRDNVVVDIYFCANGDILIVDMNQWGAPTDPLLLRTWDRDWNQEIGLKLIPPPVKMRGNISISF